MLFHGTLVVHLSIPPLLFRRYEYSTMPVPIPIAYHLDPEMPFPKPHVMMEQHQHNLYDESKHADADDDIEDDEEEEDPANQLDRAQALHTALCFLCSVNADVSEVEQFLLQHPDALLLEGTGNIPEESAIFILHEQLNLCQCSPLTKCRQNRHTVEELLRQGFSYFQTRGMQVIPQAEWEKHEQRMILFEKDIRLLRRHEFVVKQYALNGSVRMQKLRDELKYTDKYNLYKYKLSLLQCSRKHDELSARRSFLQHQLEIAAIEMKSLKHEHQVVMSKIRSIRRLQFGLLKSALPCPRRHVCGSGVLSTTQDESIMVTPKRGSRRTRLSGNTAEI